MYSSVRALLAGIIDYAGLFPPARLPLGQAFDRYRDHRHSRHGWMLGCFVCPAGRLNDLADVLQRLPDDEPVVPLALLARGGDRADAFRSTIADDLEAAAWFLDAAGGRARLDQLEVRLPSAPAEEVVADAVAHTLRHTRSLGETPPTAYFEASLLGGEADRVRASVQVVAGSRREGMPAGFKIRCGGTDAAAVPTAGAVAAAVAACRDAGLPLKATQGLHHPLRHFDPSLGTAAHGFLNLFVAGLLAREHRLGAERLAAVIADDDDAPFGFSETAVAWQELAVDVAAITRGRQSTVTSFGSCSFSEPREHLREMGLLDGDPRAREVDPW